MTSRNEGTYAFVISKYISGKAKLLLNVGAYFFIKNWVNHILVAINVLYNQS